MFSGCKVTWSICYVQCFNFNLSLIESTHSITHSKSDPGNTSLSCGICWYSISTHCRKRWTVYWTCFGLSSQNLKAHLMDALFVRFLIWRQITSDFPIQCDTILPWWYSYVHWTVQLVQRVTLFYYSFVICSRTLLN